MNPAATAEAGRVDGLMLAMTLLCGAVAVTLLVLVVTFAVRYRRGRHDATAPVPLGLPWLEVSWTVTPLAIFLGLYAWGARDFARLHEPPRDALFASVVAKQWMWTVQHREGRREIDELHVPLGEAVVLRMTSQDVIHSFFVPAFRIKQDVLPGRYTTLWFRATRTGEFHLFCAEYCGSGHAQMIGRIVVMTPADYGRWLSAGPVQPGLAQHGAALFRRLGCGGCHDARSTVHAPLLAGLPGRKVALQDGRRVLADDDYLRDSILLPSRDVVAGYEPVMPAYAGQVSEEDLQALVEWLHAMTGADEGETR